MGQTWKCSIRTLPVGSSPGSRRVGLGRRQARLKAVFPRVFALETVDEHLVRFIIVNERIERLKLADRADSMPIAG